MKKLQNSQLYKLLLVLVIGACSFAALFGGASSFLLASGGYAAKDATFEDSRRTRLLMTEHMRLAEEYLELALFTDPSGYTYYQRQTYNDRLATLESRLDPDNTNFRYTLRNENGKALYSNADHPNETWSVLGYNIAFLNETNLSFYYSNFLPGATRHLSSGDTNLKNYPLTIELGIPPTLTAPDDFQQAKLHFNHSRSAFPWLAAGTAVSAVLLLTALVLLLMAAGHTRHSEHITAGWFDRLWLDVLAAVYIPAWCCIAMLAYHLIFNGIYGYYNGEIPTAYQAMLFWGGGTAALLILLALPLFYTITVRCKSRTLLRSTLCCRLWQCIVWLRHKLSELFHALRLSWRLVIGFVLYELAALFISMLVWHSMPSYLILFFLNLFLLAVMCLWAEAFRKVKAGGKALAEGDLSYRIRTDRLPPDLRSHAEDLNNISQGMAAAVEQQMQSERFKSELITNVSHDLKTPLTSIINYVDLLKKEEIQNPKAEEYIQVLERKSQRLKKLTEDLVEASKASTGTLSVARERIGISQLVTQAAGEYEEKLAARQLTLVTNLPGQEAYVNADGRHLWRILDNLLSNCCKYALPGTRIYVDAVRQEGNVLLSVKNISRDPLNIPANQLLERFVRGDEARTTEGSGLGLSIARSLAELQGGQFCLNIDGDLFKATLSLPEAK